MIGKPQNLVLWPKLHTESSMYHDLIVSDFEDTYKNLSYKALIALHWIDNYCSNVPIVLKSDDDVFINIFVLENFLDLILLRKNISTSNKIDSIQMKNAVIQLRNSDSQIKSSYIKPSKLLSRRNSIMKHNLLGGRDYRVGSFNNSIYCLVWNEMIVLRDKSSKWYVSPFEFADKFYPKYCSGNAFFMSSSIVKKLINASKVEKFLWVDDAYITGVLPKKAKIKHFRINSLYELNIKKFFPSMVKGSKIFLHHPSHNNETCIQLWNLIADMNKNHFNEL